ncbi:hypothetical protein CWR48_01000 [Oceanobacillus arenosus]|uniref:Uncharacterized protein n=1 Tax=Oceanobacillus arenosus TaxID=1229153 RepID=A0A3D8Q4C8_9BACI|nr:hypothetical protein [Oceanobacillus arenosus]RDW22315.1 hypothetical protein CWR48_01000 [Oceanobacillus arenosus]
MNFKVLSAVGISGLLMAGGVMTATVSASSSGYDLFKTSVTNMQHLDSFTANVQASLSDNGNEIYQISSVSQMDLKGDQSRSSVSINNGSASKKLELYSNDHQDIFKSNVDEKYYVEQDSGEEHAEVEGEEKEQISPQMQKDIEGIFDSLTKNYQDSIDTKKLANGNTELQLSLSKNEIPAVGQASISFLLKNMDQQGQDLESDDFGGALKLDELIPELPQLTSNIMVSKIDLFGEVNTDQYLVGQKADIYVTGKDVNGTSHELVLHLTNKLDNIDSTNVSGIDLSGEKVVNVKD